MFLQPGETQQVSLTINRQSLSFYDEVRDEWVAEPGAFEALVGTASDNLPVRCAFNLKN